MSAPGFVRRLGRASRRLFRKLWSSIQSSGSTTSSWSSGSTIPSSQRTMSLYSFSITPSITRDCASALPPNVDAFRGNTNIEHVTQNGDSGVLSVASPSPSISAASAASAAFVGHTGSLIVVNPDPSIPSTSPASSASSASSIFSIPALVSLPSLFFVKHPQTSLEHAMSTYIYPSGSSVSVEGPVTNITRDVLCPLSQSERMSHGFSPVSSHSGWSASSGRPAFSVHMKCQTSEPVLTTPQISHSRCPSRRNDNPALNPDRVEITGTSIFSGYFPSLKIRTMESLIQLVEREGKEWSRSARSQSKTIPRAPTPRPSLDRGVFVGADSLRLIPHTLASGQTARDRRLLQKRPVRFDYI